MDLMCTSATTIGMLVTVYYICFAIGGLFCTFPDKYGRKKSLMFGLAISLVSQTVMLYSSDFWVRLAMFGLAGLSQLKNTTSYVWLSECTSTPNKASTFTLINEFDALPFILSCFFYLFVSKNWMLLPLFFCVLSYIAFGLAFLCPESPRWLLVNGNSKEAIEVLNRMAVMNRSPKRIPPNAIFVEDPKNIVALIEGHALESVCEEDEYGEEANHTLAINLDEKIQAKSPLLPPSRSKLTPSDHDKSVRHDLSHHVGDTSLRNLKDVVISRKSSFDAWNKNSISLLDVSRAAFKWAEPSHAGDALS